MNDISCYIYSLGNLLVGKVVCGGGVEDVSIAEVMGLCGEILDY